MRMLAAVAGACIGLSMSSCATYNFPVEGTVTDSSTGKPLAGAFVVAKWIRYGSTPYGARTTCPGLEVVQADANGRYRIPEGKVYLSTEIVRNVFPLFSRVRDGLRRGTLRQQAGDEAIPRDGKGPHRLVPIVFIFDGLRTRESIAGAPRASIPGHR